MDIKHIKAKEGSFKLFKHKPINIGFVEKVKVGSHDYHKFTSGNFVQWLKISEYNQLIGESDTSDKPFDSNKEDKKSSRNKKPLEKMNKDDLIAKASEIGLSEDHDLAKKTNAELINLIKTTLVEDQK